MCKYSVKLKLYCIHKLLTHYHTATTTIVFVYCRIEFLSSCDCYIIVNETFFSYINGVYFIFKQNLHFGPFAGLVVTCDL